MHVLENSYLNIANSFIFLNSNQYNNILLAIMIILKLSQ